MAEVYRPKIDQCHKAVIDFKYSIDGKDQKPKTYREDVIRERIRQISILII